MASPDFTVTDKTLVWAWYCTNRQATGQRCIVYLPTAATYYPPALDRPIVPGPRLLSSFSTLCAVLCCATPQLNATPFLHKATCELHSSTNYLPDLNLSPCFVYTLRSLLSLPLPPNLLHLLAAYLIKCLPGSAEDGGQSLFACALTYYRIRLFLIPRVTQR